MEKPIDWWNIKYQPTIIESADKVRDQRPGFWYVLTKDMKSAQNRPKKKMNSLSQSHTKNRGFKWECREKEQQQPPQQHVRKRWRKRTRERPIKHVWSEFTCSMGFAETHTPLSIGREWICRLCYKSTVDRRPNTTKKQTTKLKQ